MLVHEICSKSLHFRPEVIELVTFRIRTGRSHDLDLRMFRTDCLDERLKMLRIFRTPLLVSDSDELALIALWRVYKENNPEGTLDDFYKEVSATNSEVE